MPLLEQVLEKYPGKIKLVIKHFPLRSHKYAWNAAAAALAAQNQGKFWEFSERLFEDATPLSDGRLREIAGDLALDQEKFERDRQAPEAVRKIRKDMQDGIRAGVRGTPTIFVNGRYLRERSLSGFQLMIEKELEKSEAESPTP